MTLADFFVMLLINFSDYFLPCSIDNFVPFNEVLAWHLGHPFLPS